MCGSNQITPKSGQQSVAKSKVFNFPNTQEEEEDFLKTEIDSFEFWDWVEIKFNGVTEAQVMKSLNDWNLYLEAGIQDSDDGQSLNLNFNKE